MRTSFLCRGVAAIVTLFASADALAQCDSVGYGTGKLNSLGCLPTMGTYGTASVSAPEPFLITAAHITPFSRGALFYSFAPDAAPFFGGTRYIATPMVRTVLQLSFGNPGECDGRYRYDFNAQIQSGIDATLIVGQSVYCQYFYYDIADPLVIGMTDALRFSICP